MNKKNIHLFPDNHENCIGIQPQPLILRGSHDSPENICTAIVHPPKGMLSCNCQFDNLY